MQLDSAQAWWARLNDAGVPAGPVYSVREALEHPQIASRGMVATYPDAPGIGRDIRLLRPGFKLNGQAPSVALPPPTLGQHSDEILGELGLTPDDILQLRQEQAI